MAIAEKHLAAVFGDGIVNHKTYVIASDGDLMEGISQEAIALAGHLKLNKLIVLFDDNGISIDGALSLADSVDQVKRFEAAGWTASRIDGHDPAAISSALEKAQTSDKPVLIACKTTIGFGAPTKQGSEKSHGSPLGADEIKGARKALGWTSAPFEVPADILKAWRTAGARSKGAHADWNKRLAALDSDKRSRIRAPHERRLAEAGTRRCSARGEGKARGATEGNRYAHGLRIRARKPDPGAAGNDRRLGRSHRLQQHAHQRHEGDFGRRLLRPLHPLRRARARHGRSHERHGAARRHRSLFRHVPRVLRLLPSGDPARRSDGQAGHPRDDP